MTELLFSYGTLQKENVQLELFGRILSGTKDSLPGFKISVVEIHDEKFLSKGEGRFQNTLLPTNSKADVVEGTVFELTHEELLEADQYEPKNYERFKVKMSSGKEAWVYIAR